MKIVTLRRRRSRNDGVKIIMEICDRLCEYVDELPLSVLTAIPSIA